MTTPVVSETIQFPTPEWSSNDGSANLSHSVDIIEDDVFCLKPQSRSSMREKRQCECLYKAIKQQEDVCINLQWAARGLHSVSLAEMLQCLKRGMEVYDEILDCHSHPVEPEQISLLMSTCDMMVSGAEHLVKKVVGDEDTGDIIDQRAKSYGLDGPRLRSVKTSYIAGTGKSQKSTHQLGQLALDEEDERCVLHSLLAVRARRLSSSVERLHQVADRDGRPVHIRLIHNFRQRCKAILSSLERQNQQYSWS